MDRDESLRSEKTPPAGQERKLCGLSLGRRLIDQLRPADEYGTEGQPQPK
jgi:hypothetical protein